MIKMTKENKKWKKIYKKWKRILRKTKPKKKWIDAGKPSSIIGLYIEDNAKHSDLEPGEYYFVINIGDQEIRIKKDEFKPKCCEHPTCNFYMYFLSWDFFSPNHPNYLCPFCIHFKIKIDIPEKWVE